MHGDFENNIILEVLGMQYTAMSDPNSLLSGQWAYYFGTNIDPLGRPTHG